MFSLIPAGRSVVEFCSRNSFCMSSLSCVPSFKFLLCLQLVKKFVVAWWVVWWVWWLKPILVFSLAQAEQHSILLMIKVVIPGINEPYMLCCCVLGIVVSEFYTQKMLSHMRCVNLKMFFMLLMIQGECIVLFQPEDN